MRFGVWHPSRLLFMSGGDDCTIKIWSLPAAVTEKATTAGGGGTKKLPPVEPVRTLRGHVGPVLCGAVITNVVISDGKVRPCCAPLSVCMRRAHDTLCAAVPSKELGQGHNRLLKLWQSVVVASSGQCGVQDRATTPRGVPGLWRHGR